MNDLLPIYGQVQWMPGTRARVTIYFETFIHGHQATLEHLLGKSTSCLRATLQTAHIVLSSQFPDAAREQGNDKHIPQVRDQLYVIDSGISMETVNT